VVSGAIEGNVEALMELFSDVESSPETFYLKRVLQRSCPILATDRRQLAGQLLARVRPEILDASGATLLRGARARRGPAWRPVQPSFDDGHSGLLMVIRGHRGAIGGALYVAEAPDGPRVLSWSEDNTLRWWDAATGAQVGEAMRQTPS
jgi:WD40 repeat protein